MKFKYVYALLVSVFSLQAIAGVSPNSGGLGCGEVVSLRESTQEPLPSELADDYGGPRRTGGNVAQMLSAVPGIGVIAAVAGEIIADAAVSSVSAKMKAADKANQAQAASFKDVQAVEFRFDDGEVINIPLYVVSGMRYKVGARLNAKVSPAYGRIALGVRALFGSMPMPNDAGYKEACRIDDPDARRAMLASVKNLVDEPRIVNPNERRLNAAATPKADIAQKSESPVATDAPSASVVIDPKIISK